MAVRKRIKSGGTITTAPTATTNNWRILNTELEYFVYEEAVDPLNDIVVRFNLALSVQNSTSTSRSFPSNIYPSGAHIVIRASSDASSAILGEGDVQITNDVVSGTYSKMGTRNFSRQLDMTISRSDVPADRKLWVWVSNDSGCLASLNALSGIALVGIPSLKELVTNSNRRVTFTSGGTTYGITNMY